MDKILVKLYVPMIEEQYDILIPQNRRIHSIIKLLSKAVYELTDGYYNPNEMPTLYDKLSAKPYDYNLLIKDTNIRNGTEIVMI